MHFIHVLIYQLYILTKFENKVPYHISSVYLLLGINRYGYIK